MLTRLTYPPKVPERLIGFILPSRNRRSRRRQLFRGLRFFFFFLVLFQIRACQELCPHDTSANV